MPGMTGEQVVEELRKFNRLYSSDPADGYAK